MIGMHAAAPTLCGACLLTLLGTVSFAQRGALGELLERERAKEAQEKKIKEIDEGLRNKAEQSLDRSRSSRAGESPGSGRQVFNTEKDLPAAERKLLMVEGADAQEHLEFLKRADSGLFRILNLDERRIAVNDIRTQSAYPRIPGSGSYYSFSRRSHLADEWAEIRLFGGVILGGYEELRRNTAVTSGGIRQDFSYVSGYSIGILTPLADCPLEQVDTNHAAVEVLKGFRLPTTTTELDEIRKALASGISVGGFRLTLQVAVEQDVTYLIRSVLFKRADSVIAFRVVKMDGNQAMDILWRSIARMPAAPLKTR